MLKAEQTDEYRRWFARLRDVPGKTSIVRQIQRIVEAGEYVGDWKNVGGVIEVRIVGKGPGYRIYLSIEGQTVLLLLVGGDKSSQQKDINKAKELLKEWRESNANL